MADNNDVYPALHESMGEGDIDLQVDELYVALLDDTAVFDNANTVFSDLDDTEISGDGYTAGGAVLPNTAWVRDGSFVRYTSDDVTWQTNDSIIADNAVIYHNSTETLVAFVDFSETKTAIGTEQDDATFRIDWEEDDTVFEIEANPAE